MWNPICTNDVPKHNPQAVPCRKSNTAAESRNATGRPALKTPRTKNSNQGKDGCSSMSPTVRFWKSEAEMFWRTASSFVKGPEKDVDFLKDKSPLSHSLASLHGSAAIWLMNASTQNTRLGHLTWPTKLGILRGNKYWSPRGKKSPLEPSAARLERSSANTCKQRADPDKKVDL